MKDVGRVQGSLEASAPLIVGPTTVYVHTDIEEIEKEDEYTGETYTIYEYNEIQYPKDEYIHLMAEQNEQSAMDIEDIILLMADLVGGEEE